MIFSGFAFSWLCGKQLLICKTIYFDKGAPERRVLGKEAYAWSVNGVLVLLTYDMVDMLRLRAELLVLVLVLDELSIEVFFFIG